MPSYGCRTSGDRQSRLTLDPRPPDQVRTISPGGHDEHPGLFRVEIDAGPGSGVKAIYPALQPFPESARCADQNLYARGKNLVGDPDPRSHESSVQLRSFDTSKAGRQAGVPVLLALRGALLQKHIRGGLIIFGAVKITE